MRKENQGITEAGEFSRVPVFLLFVFRFLLSLVGAYCIRPTKRPGRGNLIYLWVGVFIPAEYMWGVFFCVPTLPEEKSRVRSWIFPMRPRPFRC